MRDAAKKDVQQSGLGRTPGVPGALVCATMLAACVGEVRAVSSERDERKPDRGTAGMRGSATGGARGGAGGDGGSFDLPNACAPSMRRRVVRLSDRHIVAAARDLLDLSPTPALQTVSGNPNSFIPNPAPGISAAVSLSLREMAEAASEQATAAGRPAVACSGNERDCARAFVERFAGRAFRRPLQASDRDGLLVVYDGGRADGGTHADGVRAIIEAVLQSPSFLYRTELGTPAGDRFELTPFELADVLSLFLRDSLPDEALLRAAAEGSLATTAGIEREVNRLLSEPTVQRNVGRAVERLLQLERMATVTKDAKLGPFPPALAAAMVEETERFVADVLWRRGGSLSELLTSGSTSLNGPLAAIYGVGHQGAADQWQRAELPKQERAGVLTQASLLTIESSDAETSVVKRGVFVMRELLCMTVPAPSAGDLETGAALSMTNPTERSRAEARAATARCAGCHARFDPLGLPFERYDALGRVRSSIVTSAGTFPVDASADVSTYDVRGRVGDAIALADALTRSRAVKACWAQQLASYALAHPIRGDDGCSTVPLAEAFERSNGDLVALVRAVATWNGLKSRLR